MSEAAELLEELDEKIAAENAEVDEDEFENHPFGDINQDRTKRTRKTAWVPKKWRPEYERMLAYSVLGHSNKMIAQELGYTKEHVSTILNMPEAEEMRIMVLGKMRGTVVKSVTDNLKEIVEKGAKLLNDSFDDPEIVKKSPFQLIDRSLDVMKGLGHLRGGGNGSSVTVNNTQNNLVVSPEVADDLASALQAAKRVRELGAGPAETITVTEVKETVNA